MQNRRFQTALFVLGSGLALLPLSSQANGLIGSSVTGGLFFTGSGTNYFDPANGFVPSGYENTAGTTVTVASPAVEFGYADSGNTDLANFSASQFTIEDVVSSQGAAGGSDVGFKMTFTDTAFAGQSLVKVSDSFPHGGLTIAQVGTTVTISWAGGTVSPNDDYTSTSVFTLVPEPSAWVAAAVGAGALGLVMLRRRRAQA